MTLFSYRGAYPQQLPSRIRLPSNLTSTNVVSLSEQELQEAGWQVIEDKPLSVYPNQIDWDGVSWYERKPTGWETQDCWSKLREHRNFLLAQTDHLVLIAYERGELPSPEVLTYRQALRDLPETTVDPWFVTWPTM